MKTIHKDVCIVGGGPAGALMGLLLARQGVDVLVLERSGTYQREFRGESIAPGSVIILDELGTMDRLEKNGFLQIEEMIMYDRGKRIFGVDYNVYKFNRKFGIDLPQPVLIQAMVDQSQAYPNYQHMMESNCLDLIEEDGKIVGVVVEQNQEKFEVRTRLVVGADGRYSRIRKLAKLAANIESFERDVIWFRLPRPASWGNTTRIKIDGAKHLIILPTFPDMLRIGFNVPKGQFNEVRKQGIQHFYDEVCHLEPSFRGVVEEHVKDWNDTTLLDIFTARVPEWSRDGLVLVGDSAHTVSPILGQGVNLAMQDAYVLTPAVVAFLKQSPDQLVPRHVMVDYETERQVAVASVQDFQAKQEKLLTYDNGFQTFLRRIVMRLADLAPWKADTVGKMSYGVLYKSLTKK